MQVTFLTNEDEERILNAATAESVLFTTQDLTEEQKYQARENIGAISIADIPKNDDKVYEKIATITVTPAADGSLPKHVVFSVDESGKPFQLTDFMVKAYAGFVSGNKSTLYMNVNGNGVIANGTVGSISTGCRSFNIFFRQEDSGFKRVEYTSSMMADGYYNAQAMIENSRLIPPMSTVVALPVTNVDIYPELGDVQAWVESSTFELWGVRA